MNNDKHNPEPWKDWTEDEDIWIDLVDGENNHVELISPRNRPRIIACINACAGIPTEDLEAVIDCGKYRRVQFTPLKYKVTDIHEWMVKKVFNTVMPESENP
jgi:hypothetical protein